MGKVPSITSKDQKRKRNIKDPDIEFQTPGALTWRLP